MLSYFILGVALLAGLLLMLRWYAGADPRTLVRVFKWFSLSVIVVVGLFLALTGRLGWALVVLPALIGWLMRFRSMARAARNFSRMAAAASGGGGDGSSEVKTRYVRMILDHATGAMDGDVIDGPFKGRRLSDLGFQEIIDLLVGSRDDEQSTQVLEAYLDREHPDWRDRVGDAADDTAPGAGPMSRNEALRVLGLEQGASAADIKAAHHRLIAGLHPDHGGSTYLAAQINQAKDVLLGN